MKLSASPRHNESLQPLQNSLARQPRNTRGGFDSLDTDDHIDWAIAPDRLSSTIESARPVESTPATVQVQRRSDGGFVAGYSDLIALAHSPSTSNRELTPAPIQRHGSQPENGAARDVHTAANHGVRGNSTELPFLDQIQRSFGRHDVSHVKAHMDGRAAVGTRAMGASAYAMGDHVVFAGSPDLHTAAHEAAHVVQQRRGISLAAGVGEAGDVYEQQADTIAARVTRGESNEALLDRMPHGHDGEAKVQRKIIVGEQAYNPKRDLPGVKKKYGADMVEVLTRMHNGGKPPEYRYATKEVLMAELSLRDSATQGMGKANSSEDNLRYSVRAGDPDDGQLDPAYWIKIGFYAFTLKPGAKPSEAIRSIFSNNDNVLECNSTMVAIEYNAMLETMGDDAFNTRFSAGGLVISPHHVKFSSGQRHPLHEQRLLTTVPISGQKDLLPGDWVYFKNVIDYSDRHPGGFWTGEHTMYLGAGKFQGFGTGILTENQIIKRLLKEYNDGLPTAQHKKIADVPGLQPYARRLVAQMVVP